ncbi:MAG: hypothetical protein K2Y23_11040 [Cyanobacteria bacterium]|nr:hypothetical protein [Cyanobacteriota bacterium]
MTPYRGHGKRHGVLAYEIQQDAIDIEFTSGWIYRFSYEKPGALRVERMKELAEAGHGLSMFISKHVKNRFASRRRKD